MTLASLQNIMHFLGHHPLTRKQPVAAVGRLLKWQVASRIHGEVIVPWIAGTRLAVRRGMTGATGNIYAGLHEFNDMAFALHFLRPGDLFADVGANVGSYTILASGVRGAHSIAFEPDPTTAASLEKNIRLNGLSNLVETHVAAVGSQCGSVRFLVGRDTENRVASDRDDHTREVALKTLDGAAGARTPSLIKIDVEGYEAEVLRGATNILSDQRLQAVLTENRSDAVVEILVAAGFHEVSYDGFLRRIAAPGEISMANALFVRNAGFVVERVRFADRISIFGQQI